jgi:hypothetical protein
MKKLMTWRLFLIATALLSANLANAQCTITEGEVTIDVHTDAFGYEGYWQLVPFGNSCGTGTVFEGGNTAVGCGGAGLQNQTPGGYGNNLTITEGPWCLPLGNQYSIIFVDDWGDGGFTFDVYVNGIQIESFSGLGLGGTYSFTVSEPLDYDLSVFGSNLYQYVTTGSYNLNAHIFNAGGIAVTSYDLNYSVDGGSVSTAPITGTNIPAFGSEQVAHPTPISIPTNGIYTVKVWATNINGNADMDNSNDTLTKQIEAGPGRPNYVDQYIAFTPIIDQVAGSAQQINDPTDLDFHPVLTNKELWVANRGTEGSGGSTVTIYDAGDVAQTSVYKTDGNAWHFMSLTTGIAFSLNGNFATSPGVFDANHNGAPAFTGPSLWSSDMAIYAQPSGGNGSHLDMLHLSPYSQGITGEVDNVFWVFDGNSNDIVRYDFAEDHGPGADDHSDGIIRRYSDDAVAKDPASQIVSHLVLDDEKKWLYTVDHGNQRVIRIDITTGSNLGGIPAYPQNEPIAEYSVITGYTQETVVTGLAKPAGIDVIDDRMIVSEYQTGEIIIYDISTMPAVELHRISTGLTSVQGIKIGPNGRIWFVDGNSDGVYKIETANLGVDEVSMNFSVYPNPSNGILNVLLPVATEGVIDVRDVTGKVIAHQSIDGLNTSVNVNATAGIYFLTISVDGKISEAKKVIIN